MSLVTLIEALINDVGTGINESTLRNRLVALRDEAEAVEAALERAESDVKQLETYTKNENLTSNKDATNESQIEFLKILFKEGVVSIDYIARRLGIEYEMAQYHKDALTDSGMIRWTGGTTGDFGEGDPTYELTRKGRAYLVENHLV